MARPTKLTKQVKTKILEALKLGATREHAASYAGIAPRTFYNWMAQGKGDQKGPYLQFFHDVKKAEGENTVVMLGIVKAASEDDWKAAAWCLERCRGYTRTKAVHLTVETEQDDTVEQEAESVREMLLKKLERMAQQERSEPSKVGTHNLNISL